MSAESGGKPQNPLSAMLDFGPETTTAAQPAPSDEVTRRLKNLVKAIQDISRRVDELTGTDR